MDIQFEQLISCSIKRLTRPKFKNEFPQFYDSQAFREEGIVALPEDMQVIHDQETLNELMNRCDVSYDGVSAAGAINFNPSFGKICTGEHFKVLFTI